MFAVDEFQLVELHVLRGLFDGSLLLHDLFLQGLDEFEVLWPGWALVIELCDLAEAAVQLLILLVHEHARVLELLLQLSNLGRLLLYELFKRLPQVVLQLDLLFFELKLDFAGASCMFIDGLLHALVRSGNFSTHVLNFSVLRSHGGLQALDISLKGLDPCSQFFNFISEPCFYFLGLIHGSFVLFEHFLDCLGVLLLLLGHLGIKLLVQTLDLISMLFLRFG